jgi:chromosomal replication initiation ATPase DnaA
MSPENRRKILERMAELSAMYEKYSEKERLAYSKDILKHDPLAAHCAYPERTERILSNLCEQFGVTKADLKSKNRRREVVNARKCAAFALNTENRLSCSVIAVIFGVDHSSISYYKKAIVSNWETDPNFYNDCAKAYKNASCYVSFEEISRIEPLIKGKKRRFE